ncbi:hypothetical protein [Bradyrhizobium sp. JYMT SZCCT0428]|uniref:hypothetical protein n=1 Tax=Bradyrhizobium sp. JYMT SZCCT0428 TaxID=2807673 RepID=UPI001BAC4955|nr:hypothetical protein [Bradyrhizobium sp. JYMT SZCCT0428]MBR1157506.1 hypothetical protein [Bradyrhizobium sp. JYMT SZCCT0428]
MAYEGEQMTSCPAAMFDFSKAYAVVVTGAKFNPYGHMLLNTGGKGGKYFQVSDVIGNPRMMNEAQFQRYLRENNKTIVTVMRVNIPHPNKSQMKLEQVLSEKWTWGAVVNNCESMVEEIVMAGGGPKLRRGVFPLPMNATNMCESW